MISVEASAKGGSKAEWKEEKSGANWDPSSFQQQILQNGEKWHDSAKRKKSPSRFQDITMEIEEKEQHEGNKPDKSWPFESSPCAWSGGLNTKSDAASQEINRKMFDPNFADGANQVSTDFEDIVEDDDSDFDSGGDSFCGDSEPEVPDPHAKYAQNDGRTQSYCSTLAWNKANDTYDSSDDEDDVKKYQEKKFSATLDSSSAHVARTRKGSGRPSKHKRSSDPMASASCHGQIETKTKRKTSRRRSSNSDNDMLSATCHGKLEKVDRRASSRSQRRPKRREDEPVALPGENHPISSSSKHRSRTKSATVTRSNSGRDELGGVSVHGVSSVSRVRGAAPNSRRLESSRNRHGEYRTKPGRAMSSVNVKPPEEHYHVSRRDPTDEGLDVSRSGGRRRHHSSHEKLVRRSSSSRNLTRKNRSSSRFESDGDDECLYSKDRNPNRTSNRRRSAPEPRDLLMLLRDNRTVLKNDFLDKENRRLLHFLMYEHKMEVSMKGLYGNIQQEIEGTDDAVL